MSDTINTTMIMSASDNNKTPLAFDHDSQKLTIIFGTLATLIALFGLVFAALTWHTPRRRPSAGSRASNGHDLESNEPRNATPMVQDPPDAVNTTSGIGGAAPSSLAIDPSPGDVDTIVPMPLRHQSLCEGHAVIQQDLSNNTHLSTSAASSREAPRRASALWI